MKVLPKVSIFGGCATRDVTIDLENVNIEVKTQIARQTVVSSLSNPVLWEFDDLEYPHQFNKRMLKHDFLKDTFSSFSRDCSEFLILDLIEETYQNINFKNSIITYSRCLKDSEIVKEPNFIKYNSKWTENTWEYILDIGGIELKLNSCLEHFTNKIMEIYSPHNIVLHKVFYSYHYRDTMGNVTLFSEPKLKRCKKMNTLLEFMYNYLECKFKGCFIIDVSRNFFCCENHQWGLAPFHYEAAYKEAFETILIQHLNCRTAETFSDLSTPLGRLFFYIEKTIENENFDLSVKNKEGIFVLWGCGEALYDIIFPEVSFFCNELKKQFDFLISHIRFVDQQISEFLGQKVTKPEAVNSLKNLMGVVITPRNEVVQSEIRENLNEMGICSEKILLLKNFIRNEA